MNNHDKIFRKDGKAFVLAMDHPLTMPSPDLKDPQRIIETAAECGVDAFLASYGCIRHFRQSFGSAGVILRADGGATMLSKPAVPLELLYDSADAESIGADAVLCMGFPGSQLNRATLGNVSRLVRDAHKAGIAAGAEMLPYGFEKVEDVDTRSVENVSFACRLGAEMGADFIKTEFVGGARFAEVVANCYVPVLVLGGSKAKSAEELLCSVSDAMAAGAAGVIMGRNIVRSKNMGQLCMAVSSIIHEGISKEEALEIAGEL